MSSAEDLEQAAEENINLVEEEKISDQNMTSLSKEKNLEKEQVSSDDGILSLIYIAAKKIFIVGTIYLVGYMQWSIAWLIAPVIFSVARDQWRQTTNRKRNIAKASAMACEKDIILARIDELPAWVYFPDIERCEWVNKILNQVWPNANHYARTLVKETIEPNIAESLSNYKLHGFKFDRIILGTIPPRIGGVKVYDKNISRNEIIMDLDLFYASDCNFNFFLSGVKGGIKDFQIHGTVRVIMKPLIRSMPLVGGLQVFFLNNPNVDFDLVGIADLLDMPGLSDILRRVIVEQIAAIMVLPNKLPITLSDEVPAFNLKMPEPEGVLRVHVIEAKDLMKKDIGVLGKGKSDPYTIINVGAQEFKTKVIKTTVNPRWDYWCEAIIYSESGQYLQATLYDYDDTSNDEFLGRASVEINKVIKKGSIDTWLVLEEAKHGMLHVRLEWLKLSANPSNLQAAFEETHLLRVSSMSTAVLSVFIDSAKNLPQARSQSKPDPYLVLSVGKHTEKTSVQMRNDSPVWEQGFTFLVSNPENDTLQLKIFDQKTGNEIGRYSYILSTLLIKTDMEIISQPYQLYKSGAESKIIMSLSLRILQHADVVDNDTPAEEAEITEVDNLSRSSSLRKKDIIQENPEKSVETQSISSINPSITSISEDEITKNMSSNMSITPPGSPGKRDSNSPLVHRVPDTTTSSGEFGLGRIHITIRYTIQRQKLSITVHKIMNIPLNDPSNIPDPYVKLYLLPGRSKDSKRKTHVIKDNCNPIYESTFEYIISASELMSTELEVTICSQKGFLYGGSPIIGMVRIPLSIPEINQGYSSWYDLQREVKNE